MDAYRESKTARRVAAVAYILFMTFIVGGTLLSQQNNTPSNNTTSREKTL